MARKQNPELRAVETNDLNDEQKGALFAKGIGKLQADIRRKDEAVAAIRLTRKQMKVEGFTKDEVDYALWMLKQENDEPKENVEMQVRVSRWLQRPLGLQSDLFAA